MQGADLPKPVHEKDVLEVRDALDVVLDHVHLLALTRLHHSHSRSARTRVRLAAAAVFSVRELRVLHRGRTGVRVGSRTGRALGAERVPASASGTRLDRIFELLDRPRGESRQSRAIFEILKRLMRKCVANSIES